MVQVFCLVHVTGLCEVLVGVCDMCMCLARGGVGGEGG